jgi:hypothetical protein
VREMSREEVASRIRALIYNLNSLENRLVNALVDVLHPDGSSRVLLTMNLRECRDLMQRLLKDIDEILKLVTESQP